MQFSRLVRVHARPAVVAGLALSLMGVAPVWAYADPAADLDAARAQLGQIGSEYQRINGEIERLSIELQQTTREIEQTAGELKGAQKSLSDMASSGYKGGGITLQKVLFGSTNFEDLISGLFYLGKVSDAQAKAIAQVKSTQKRLQEQQASQAAAMDDAEKRLTEQAENQRRAQSLVSSLDAQVRAQIESEAKSNAAIASGIDSANDAQSAGSSISPAPGETGGSSGAGDATTAGGGTNSGANRPPEPAAPPATGGGSEGTVEKPTKPDTGGSHGGSSSVGAAAVSIALQFEGAPYVYGGASPEVGFDCSGLTMYAYAQLGYHLPHSASGQMSEIQRRGRFTTNINELQYGDLVFFPGHVAFYVGGGNIFGARREGVPASTCPMKYFGTFLGGGNL